MRMQRPWALLAKTSCDLKLPAGYQNCHRLSHTKEISDWSQLVIFMDSLCSCFTKPPACRVLLHTLAPKALQDAPEDVPMPSPSPE